MKPTLIPVYFDPGRDEDFDVQLDILKKLLSDSAQFANPVQLGVPLPEGDAVVFPQFLGEGYRRLEDFRSIPLPILVLTSQFGTLSMWDWELIGYLRSEGVETIAPYNLVQTKKVCNALRVKRELKDAKFVVYQDNPGEGAQASIFKRFFWWEDQCTERMKAKFGLHVVKRSFRHLCSRARAITDAETEKAGRQAPVPTDGVHSQRLSSALKLYLAVKHDLEEDGRIRAVGINCLNESHYSDTTPCLAWNLLYEQKRLIWGCEGDTLSMLTKYLLHNSLEVPIFMTNLYPFLLGDAALKHERIDKFPSVEGDPANYVLIAHCGYMGVIPQSFSSEWTLKKKVLPIVDDNATAIDARIPLGPITLAKLSPSLQELTIAEGELTGYAQYPGSDCLNGGIIRVRDGRRLMTSLSSHHSLVMTGHNRADIEMIAKIFNLKMSEI